MKTISFIFSIIILCEFLLPSLSAYGLGVEELNYNKGYRPSLPNSIIPVKFSPCKGDYSKPEQKGSGYKTKVEYLCDGNSKNLNFQANLIESQNGATPYKVEYRINNQQLINTFDHYRLHGACYSTDLNNDQKLDAICEIGNSLNGIGSEKLELAFLISKNDSYSLNVIESWSLLERDFFKKSDTSQILFMHTLLLRGKKHNYWAYHLIGFHKGELVSKNKAIKGFPFYVSYTKKPNNQHTQSLSQTEKLELLKEKDLLWLLNE